MSSFGLAFLPLESWLPLSILSAPPDPYLGALVALGRTARSGCAATMVHYTRPSGQMDLVAESRAVAAAARDIGIRIAFALALRDRNPLTYGDDDAVFAKLPKSIASLVRAQYCASPKPARAQVELTEEIAEAIEGPLVKVQYGPAGVQWCSDDMLELVAERSAATGRRVHMHFLETIYQREWADRTYKNGIVAHLDSLGLLSSRLTLVHCVHARPDEIEILAERGVHIVNNPSSNLHLRSGIAPLGAMYNCGCQVAIGMDGQTIDEDQDMLREMRLAHAIHGGRGYHSHWQPDDLLNTITRNGRRICDAPGDGVLAPGNVADFMVLDYDSIDRDALMGLPPLDLLFARASASALRDLVVDGRAVVTDRTLVAVDIAAAETELRKMYRLRLQQGGDLKEMTAALRQALPQGYSHLDGCGA